MPTRLPRSPAISRMPDPALATMGLHPAPNANILMPLMSPDIAQITKTWIAESLLSGTVKFPALSHMQHMYSTQTAAFQDISINGMNATPPTPIDQRGRHQNPDTTRGASLRSKLQHSYNKILLTEVTARHCRNIAYLPNAQGSQPLTSRRIQDTRRLTEMGVANHNE